jgi:hypothetical protein
MTTSEDLFNLIKSLSKSEKKYFKQHATLYIREGGNTYLLLFDAINDQKKYDEKKLTEQFKEFRFTKQFPVAKNFLYNRIMSALESYHNSSYQEVRELIHRAEILYEKGLFSQSLKIIRKAKKIATLRGMHHALLEIAHNWESNIALKQMDTRSHIRILDEGKKHLKNFETDLNYASISARFVEQYFNYGKTKNKQHLKKMDALIRDPLLQDSSKATTHLSKMRLYEANLFYRSAIADEQGVYEYTKKLALLLGNDPEKIKQFLVNYMVNLYNLIEVSISLKKLEEVPGYLEKLRATETLIHNQFLRERFFIWNTSSILNYNSKKAFFSETLKRVPEITIGLEEYANTLQDIEKASLYSHIAVSFFALKNYTQCLHWLNKIRDELALTTNPDFQTENKIFYLVVHFEMKNSDLLPYLAQSLYRYLVKKERALQFEKPILSFLKKQSSVTDKKELVLSFKELKKQLNSLPEKISMSHFDFTAWLESKIEDRTFSEIIKERSSG